MTRRSTTLKLLGLRLMNLHPKEPLLGKTRMISALAFMTTSLPSTSPSARRTTSSPLLKRPRAPLTWNPPRLMSTSPHFMSPTVAM